MKCPVQMQRVNRQKCLVKMLTYFKCNPVRYPISICFHCKKRSKHKILSSDHNAYSRTHIHTKKESKNLFVICDSADKLICLCCVVETQTDPENIFKYAASLSTTWTENSEFLTLWSVLDYLRLLSIQPIYLTNSGWLGTFCATIMQ